MTTEYGHVVRALYLEAGVADVAAETSDAALLATSWRLAARVRDANMLVRGRPSDVLPTRPPGLTAVARLLGYAPGQERALEDDYRLSVLWHITTPVHQVANNIPPVIWWNNLERVFLAVDDLGCRDLVS